MPSFAELVAAILLVWCVTVIVVQAIGISAIFRYFSRKPLPPISSKLVQDAPEVTIIRPVKGVEPHLYDCIASTFLQDYPVDRFCIRLCIEDANDPAYPILQKLVADFPTINAQVLIEKEDPILYGTDGHVDNLGPNPKIRNISRAYREAKGDIVWVIDCNVWVATSVLGRMVDKLVGFSSTQGQAKPFKFVHHMPIVVDIVDYKQNTSTDGESLLLPDGTCSTESSLSVKNSDSVFHKALKNGGGRLDEMFMATTHVKFYGAINAVGIAPCIVGKSNMFRKSHLEQATDPRTNLKLSNHNPRPTGIDYFSHHICEDHLIGELLWYVDIPGFSNHGLAWGDLVVQPMSNMSIAAYMARRCRWLRARKFTVLAATLVEPGVESLLCCAYLAYGITTLPFSHSTLGLPQTWTSMFIIWLSSVAIWMVVDLFIFRHLHSGVTIPMTSKTPTFARGSIYGGLPPRRLIEWVLAWVGREVMALPIWTYAVLLGTTVNWRGKRFYVNMDTTVVALDQRAPFRSTRTPELERARQPSKDRVD